MEDKDFPTFLRDMKHGWEKLWEKEWKKVMQLAERKERIVNGSEVSLSVQASECEGNQNSDLEKVTGSETFAELFLKGQAHGSDQNERLYVKWLEIMFEISAKKSIAEKKETKIQNEKTIKERYILEEQTQDWSQIFSTIHWQVKLKVEEKCRGGKMTSEWSEVLEKIEDIQKKLKKKREEEAKSEHSEKDQTSDWDEIFEKSGDILYLLEDAGKIERATAIQLAMAARDKHKKALFGDMEIEGSGDDDSDSW